ncbi:DNA repair protein XRCC3 isoform X4 [Leucoraja erinacea]|uniref:DNA repair protein XRCC3 isoform X4 n=1 Tax=Leucoraja erinaceus TaxID=7782 RepID=UPI00245762A4|nr:DNA repair protein XRCC3 isoform X4 [Leucoraja erinacea]
MDWWRLDLNPKVVAAVRKANIQSMKEILSLSGPDLQRLTKLSNRDVQYLHKTVAVATKSDPVVTGAVYICTEDAFPNKRLQQLIAFQPMLRADVPADVVNNIKFGNNIFIEHVADVESFNHCLSKRIPILLSRGLIRLVVIDSIAALVRCEFGAADSIVKAKCLQKFGTMLHHLSHRFCSPIICVNQVTGAVSDSHLAHSELGLLDRRVLPALGLTWSNQLLMRLMVCRTHICIEGKLPEGEVCASTTGTVIRRMEIIFAPHLPQSFCNYIINEQGVRGMKERGVTGTREVGMNKLTIKTILKVSI